MQALLVAFLTLSSESSSGLITISDAYYQNRDHFKIETLTATYFYDRNGGGFSRLLDRDGNDWIAYNQEPSKGPGAAGGGYRGLPNLLTSYEKPESGVGHPGFDQCKSTVIATDAIRSVCNNGRWAWTWRFTVENAVLTIEQADPDRPYWFTYEGVIGGRWSPDTHYWGTDLGGPYREMPQKDTQKFDRWQWIYLGDKSVPRVLLLMQIEYDKASDNLWYLGNSPDLLDSTDGMAVFGFGRGPNGPLLNGAGQRFVLGFVEKSVKKPNHHWRLASVASRWRDNYEAKVRVSETSLYDGGLASFRIETPSATYFYGKYRAGFAEIRDPQGRSWFTYRSRMPIGEDCGLSDCASINESLGCGLSLGKLNRDNPFSSSVTIRKPRHVRIHSETQQGDVACNWDFYPTHASVTLLNFPAKQKYLFSYKGAPGGQFNYADDFTLRPGDKRQPLSNPWSETVPWVLFGAHESPYGLLLVNHQTGNQMDSYSPYPFDFSEQQPFRQAALFGFGLSDGQNQSSKLAQPYSLLPARFSVAITPDTHVEDVESTMRQIGTLSNNPYTGHLFGSPHIDVWNGDEQHFGRLGVPIKWVNVLGHVSPGDGLDTLQYSLNGGALTTLTVGPDDRRLANKGDFNVELEYDELHNGLNNLSLVATDGLGRRTQRSVNLYCHRGNIWPLPYTIDWMKVHSISDVVQVVDGKWTLEKDGIRTVDPNYDRAIALGDRTWTDYSVTVAVTFHGYTPPNGGPPTYGVSHASIAARFPGHYSDNRQPHTQWFPLGGAAEFRLGEDLDKSSWRIFRDGAAKKYPTKLIQQSFHRVELGVRYLLKLRVDSLPGPAARYRVKYWKDGESEPAQWDMDTKEGENPIKSGGVLIIAHNTDVTFGKITVTPKGPDDL